MPADGRILRSATLETQEAALTGESAPIPKDAATIADPDTTLGDRTNSVFQNTQVTRGTASVVITDTGMTTQMGQIASMLSSVKQAKSPLQRELDSLTGVLGWIAWGAVAVIIITGLIRGDDLAAVILLGISMAISAIPTGMPSFVQAMLSFGSRQLAEHNAVVKNLTDVETLGATSAINSDKTGTLTMNEMTVESLYLAGEWFTVGGNGYEKTGEILRAAGAPNPDFGNLALGLTLCSDATVSDDGAVVGDPTEAALVVLAAKMGADAELTRSQYPRVSEVPFDSAYKFMGTYHQLTLNGVTGLYLLVKGGPDVVLDRCSTVSTADGPASIEVAGQTVLDANRKLSEQGLRVLAFAVRRFEPGEAVPADPMDGVKDLTLVGLVGIIDPLRPSSKEAVRIAHAAGIDVRMITGDHAITAAAIGSKLGLGPGAASGADIQAMTDDELKAALPNLHVFGRVTPEDKLRLARLMQENGDVVAMTGDAVNDAAALKQADIGVAMGSGSEVTKQAGKMILVDDNFGTLVTAVKLGRAIYDKIVSYVRYQMSQLFSLVLLFLVASLFNINHGVPLHADHDPVPELLRVDLPGDRDPARSGRGRHHAQAPARPEEDDRQRRRGDPLVHLRRAAVPDDPDPAPDVPRPAEPDRAERAGHDDVRRRGLRSDLRRTRHATRSRARSHGADPRSRQVAVDPDRTHRRRRRGAVPAEPRSDHVAQRQRMADLHRSRAGRADLRRGREVDPPSADRTARSRDARLSRDIPPRITPPAARGATR